SNNPAAQASLLNHQQCQTANRPPATVRQKNAAEILTNIRRIRLRRCPSYIDIGATPSTGNFTKFRSAYYIFNAPLIQLLSNTGMSD
ncbi:hypothetical protein, partial [Sneathiella sp.]|uniref:hypothetical protein n=1 Tax=Sneathiella sp. TaxID=1964365 RepID=UPI002FE0F53A